MFDKSGNGPNLVLISEKLCQFAYTKMALFCVSSALRSSPATLATVFSTGCSTYLLTSLTMLPTQSSQYRTERSTGKIDESGYITNREYVITNGMFT